jgi:hypothetical protein
MEPVEPEPDSDELRYPFSLSLSLSPSSPTSLSHTHTHTLSAGVLFVGGWQGDEDESDVGGNTIKHARRHGLTNRGPVRAALTPATRAQR